MLGEPEVEHLDHAIGRHFDVRGLEVAVDEAVLVGAVERAGDLPRNRQRLRNRQTPPCDARPSCSR